MTNAQVKAWRVAHRLTIKQAAMQFGMTQRGWSLWEQDGVRLVPWFVAAILHYADCAHKADTA